MLGLRPRLKARNSLWDLVNKHPLNSHPTSLPSWKQPVEEGADGLRLLPFSLPLSSSPSPEQAPHLNHSTESSAPFTMARVSSTTSIALCDPAEQANDSQRKTRRDLNRRQAKSNMVGLHWSWTLGIRELHDADCRLAQDLSSPFRGTWTAGKPNEDSV